jgi:uncharacterized protein YndB with AHSA1/START domain
MDKNMPSSGSQTMTRESDLIITRIIDAPRKRVFKAWTNPDDVKQWWGPKNFTSSSAMINLRVGGTYLLDMRGPDGKDYWSTGTYREVVVPERVVSMDSFADEKGNIVPASHYGLSADYPLETMLTVTFEEVNGRTKVTIDHSGAPASDSMNEKQGWNESLDKLADMLEMETPPC